ncbi:MAG: dihydropyrimidinase [Thermoanaerobaculales bacterium]
MRFDTIVTGGKVVTPAGVSETDIGIRDEKISALGTALAEEAYGAAIVDAAGHYVLPGVIDVHVHLDLPFCGTVSSDDYRSGTRAGARGGVTTLIDFAIPFADESLSQAVDNWHQRAEGKAMIDYSFHLCITRWHEHRHQIKEMFERGVPSFKEFMIYESEGWQSDDRALFCTLEELRDLGGMLMVHAETSRVLDELIERRHNAADMRRHGARLHAMTRPAFTEYEAIQRAITWSEVTGGTLYVVHMSTGAGAAMVRKAQQRGVNVLAETCPQYLVLDDSVFGRDDGHLFATCPQIKKAEDSARLWKGVAAGEVSVISTDTCSFTREQKATWEGDWTKIPMGMPGLETLLPIAFTKGVLAGRIELERMVACLATNPAKIMGLYPKKGVIQVGSDADLAIIHPETTIAVDPAKMETNTDWSPFEGWELAGFARTTIARGEVIVDDYRVVGEEGRGQWLPRSSAGIPGGQL